MANFSKYFYETVKKRTCGDFFHPGMTCTEAKLNLLPKLIAGSMKYFLPILLLPSLTKLEWTWDFFKKQMILSGKAVFGGVLPAIVAISFFCGSFNHLKRHYLQFYGLPVSLGTLLSAMVLPPSFVNVLASGGMNHLIELILEASKRTIFYKLKSDITVGTLTFMTLSSTIVYLFRTCQYRPFWLLHVPHKPVVANGQKTETIEPDEKQRQTEWMDFLLRSDKKVCSHQEKSCEDNVWQELKKVSKISLILSSAKSLISSYSFLRSAKVHEIPWIFIRNLDIRSLIFLPAYCGCFKFIHCLLNRMSRVDSTNNTILAGFLSGSLYPIYPNFTLISFAFIRNVQLLWMKHVKDYQGDDKVMAKLKGIPMGMLIMWISATILFLARFMYPYISSKYINVCLNYLTGSLSDSVVANYYGILMGLQ